MGLRLADPLIGLCTVADLGFGLPPGEALRSCALATALARRLNLPDNEVLAVYYTALLQHVGCVGYAHETAAAFGDELSFNAAAGRTNDASPRDMFATFLPELTRGRGPVAKLRLTVAAMARGTRFGANFSTAACEVGRAAQLVKGYGDVRRRMVGHFDRVLETVLELAEREAATGGNFEVSRSLAARYRTLVLEGPESEARAAALAVETLTRL